MTKVYVYIFSDETNSHIEDLFKSEIFKVIFVNKNDIPVPDITVKNLTKDEICEAYQFQYCLEKTSKGCATIILKNYCFTSLNKDQLESKILDIMEEDKNFDIFYMCRWQDECQKMINIKQGIYRTYSPKGIQAVYISNRGKDIILRRNKMKCGNYFSINQNIESCFLREITEGNLIAYCYFYNIFEYDINKYSSNLDFNKLSLCQNMVKNESNESSNLGYLWFVIVILIILIIIFAIIRIGK